MNKPAHHQPSASRAHQMRTAALITSFAAALSVGIYAQRHREELAILGTQRGVASDPQT